MSVFCHIKGKTTSMQVFRASVQKIQKLCKYTMVSSILMHTPCVAAQAWPKPMRCWQILNEYISHLVLTRVGLNLRHVACGTKWLMHLQRICQQQSDNVCPLCTQPSIPYCSALSPRGCMPYCSAFSLLGRKPHCSALSLLGCTPHCSALSLLGCSPYCTALSLLCTQPSIPHCSALNLLGCSPTAALRRA